MLARSVTAIRTWTPPALAALLLALVALKAVMAIDLVWDSLSYHIPFSALRAGLLTDWEFQRPPPEQDTLKGYYLGFPILADLLRGWMWKLSGRPESVNLLGIFSLLALAAYLKWRFRSLEVAWAILGVLAIPAVQTAAASAYVDLPASVAFMIFLLSVVDLWSNPERFRRPAPWLVMFLAAFAAANIKLQTSLLVCLALPFLVPPIWQLLREKQASWRRYCAAGLLMLSAAALVCVNLIKNVVLYRNPLFPIDLKIAGIHLPGTLLQQDWNLRGTTYQGVPQPLLWLLSVLEYRSLDGRSIPYMNGMGDVPHTSLSAYMGGFFSALVAASLCFLVLCVVRRPDRFAVTTLVVLLASGLLASAFPNSENLRYEIFWMMFLVIGCLLLLTRPEFEAYLRSYKIVLLASLAFVVSVTRGIYFIPVSNPTQAYIDRTNAERLLERIVQPGDVVCLEQGPGQWDNRFAIMFAPIFHQKLARERPYAVKEGFCGGYKTIPRGGF
jgi:hypothetical protein